MIMASIILLMAFMLICAEFYLPGGIMGASGAMLFLVSVVIFAIHSDTLLSMILFLLISVSALILMIKFVLSNIKKSKGSIYLESDQEGYKASYYDKDLIGKEAIVASDLKPSGHIIVEGKKLQAVSLVGYIRKGSKVIIIEGDGFSSYCKIIKRGKIMLSPFHWWCCKNSRRVLFSYCFFLLLLRLYFLQLLVNLLVCGFRHLFLVYQ